MKRKTKLLFLASAIMLGTSVTALAVMQTNVAQAQETNVFEMVDGASIRTIDPTGIRFKTKMSEYYYNQLTAENSTTELHVVVIPYAYYQAYQADTTENKGALYPWLVEEHSAEGILDLEIPAEKLYAETKDGETYYYANAVMSNIYFNNYNVDFVGVAYLQNGNDYQDVTGITEKDNVRSIFEVAYKAAADPAEYAAHGTFLDEIMEKSMYNAYGVTYDKATAKYVCGGTNYESWEGMKDAVGLDLSETTLTIGEETAWIFTTETKKFTPVLKFSDETVYSKPVDYTWTSSNKTVATVENGLVTPVAAGSTTITVSAMAGKYTASCTLTVKDIDLMSQTGTWGKGVNTPAWDAEELAWCLTLDGATYNANQNFTHTSLDTLKGLVSRGYSYATFKVKASSDFATDTLNNIGVYVNRQGLKTWVNGTEQSGRKNLWKADYSLYTGALTTDYISIMIDLQKIAEIEEMHNSNGESNNASWAKEEMTSLAIYFGGAQNSRVWLKDFTPLTVKQYYETLNLMDKNHTFLAYHLEGSTTETKAVFDTQMAGIKAIKTTDGAGVDVTDGLADGRLKSTDAFTLIKKAIEAGMTHLTFECYADKKFVDSQDNSLKVYINQGTKNTTKAKTLIKTISITEAYAWQSYEIDLTTENVKSLLESQTCLQLIVGGDIGATLYIRNMSIIKK